MNKKNKVNFVKKSAFTLIELSVVIIIIGILIAGISAGGALIKGAEIRSIMSDARTYGVAIKAYFVQYDSLPGDGTKDPKSSGYVGDNDGKIEYQSKTCGVADDSCKRQAGEGFGAVHTLGVLRMVNPSISVATTTPFGVIGDATITSLVPGVNFPSSKRKSLGWVFDNITVLDKTRNVVVLTGSIPTFPVACSFGNNEFCNMTKYTSGSDTYYSGHSTANIAKYNGISPKDAFDIDNKMDDGIPDTGRITSTTYAITGDTAYLNSCYNDSTKQYNKGEELKNNCLLFFRADNAD
ncbi:MAG: prepilin-type N-terminal cleavage/methylation domain-containing protein [Rickettsiales bacterium]|nr:prepilin-type N-terminal cleavage/methylation domain-containing protein [Rickettsiales bacterium]